MIPIDIFCQEGWNHQRLSLWEFYLGTFCKREQFNNLQQYVKRVCPKTELNNPDFGWIENEHEAFLKVIMVIVTSWDLHDSHNWMKEQMAGFRVLIFTGETQGFPKRLSQQNIGPIHFTIDV